MSEIAPPNPSQPEPAVSEPVATGQANSPWHGVIAFGIIIIVVIGIGFYLFKHNSNKTPNQPSADSIRQLFGYNPPESPISTQTAVPQISATSTIRSGYVYTKPAVSRPRPISRPIFEPASTPAQSTTYQNAILAFRLRLPANWRIHSTTNSAVFANGQGQNFEVEMLIAYSGSLNDVQILLQGSPSVVNIRNTTFQGNPALSYTTRDGQSNLAVIYQGKLYYILGAGGNAGILSTFSFLG